MPSSATWDGQLSGSGVQAVDPFSPKPASGPTSDPWGMPAPVVQSHHQSMPSTANDPWTATPAPVTTSKWMSTLLVFITLQCTLLVFNLTVRWSLKSELK